MIIYNINMSDDHNTVNTPEERQHLLAQGLDDFSGKSERSPTPKSKKPNKGRFASMASNVNSTPTPTSTAAMTNPPQQSAPINPSAQTQVVSGRLVGSGANEPVWSTEQLQHFSSLRSLKLPIVKCMDTRKASEDSEGKYVVKNPDGTCSATTSAMLPTLPFSEFKIGLGDPKPDEKLPKKKMYSDVVIIGKDDDWVLNQWVVQNVIMEPVPSNVRNSISTGRAGGGSRKIGVHFARFGFPAECLAPVFHTLNGTVNGIIDSLVMTDGYYWCNASWGVSQAPGTFVYITENKARAHTSQLSEAMDMLGTKSSQGVGTFAISLACEYEKEGDRIVPSSAKYVFSIKCHSFVHFRKTDYHGPPQTASVGALMSNDMMMMAEPLSKPKLVSSVMGSTGNLFGGGGGGGAGGGNPFGSMNSGQGPHGDSKQPMSGGNMLV